LLRPLIKGLWLSKLYFVYYSILKINVMRELLKKLMLDTVSKLKDKGLNEKEAIDQVIGLIELNRDSINDLFFMKTILNNLIEIN
jgi:hypothetical protein